jgi:condensin complex subunit 2
MYCFDAYSYAKVSKRVDVHKLKGDVWTNIQDHLGAAVKSTRRQEVVPDTVPHAEEVSFQELVQDLSTNKQQKDVSLAYYFICLLHLANENVSTSTRLLLKLSQYCADCLSCSH